MPLYTTLFATVQARLKLSIFHAQQSIINHMTVPLWRRTLAACGIRRPKA